MNYISVLIQNIAGPMGRVLIGKTPEGTWTFPTGRQRTNETAQEACQRIAWETLGIKVSVGKCTMVGHKRPEDGYSEHILNGNITHNTNTRCDYHNYYEAVNTWQTQPKSDINTEMCWVHPSELGQYDFDGDDKSFMAKYDPWINGRSIPDVRMY
ncbi:MAG: NUDIX domain-containing protein [Oscillospiraceae bacterium]|nr:NUDIX domain-containing protein [Oscillospiraceae bacterium]